MQENSTVNSLVAIILQNLPKVTSTQHKANKYYNDFFYPALNLTINCEIVDFFANKLYKTVAQGLSPATIATLLNSISHITLQKKKIAGDIMQPLLVEHTWREGDQNQSGLANLIILQTDSILFNKIQHYGNLYLI